MEPKEFTINDLISFGQYLLSEQRQKYVSTLLEKDVTHADICNWNDKRIGDEDQWSEYDKLIYEEIMNLPITDKMVRDSIANEIYEKALINICNPLDYLKSELKEGENLNGDQTLRILDSVQFYKTIAFSALVDGKKLLKNNEIPPLPEKLQNTDWMKEPVKYDCVDNDNHIILGVDEIEIGTPLSVDGKVVVSKKDLNQAIMLFNLRYSKE